MSGADNLNSETKTNETSNQTSSSYQCSNHAWPETSSRRRIRDIFNSWTYGYMKPILRKGRRLFQEEEQLEIGDLFEVPSNSTSEYLVKLFWCVLVSVAKDCSFFLAI